MRDDATRMVFQIVHHILVIDFEENPLLQVVLTEKLRKAGDARVYRIAARVNDPRIRKQEMDESGELKLPRDDRLRAAHWQG